MVFSGANESKIISRAMFSLMGFSGPSKTKLEDGVVVGKNVDMVYKVYRHRWRVGYAEAYFGIPGATIDYAASVQGDGARF